MKIKMAGLDYKNSELSVREKFAVGKEKSKNIIAAYMSIASIKGCVIISTCNRTEIYVSIQGQYTFNIADFFCQILGLDIDQYASHFCERDEKESFFHLCSVGAGLDSQILGDDQIITQVREALELSRASGFTDSYIETMFRIAIKSAKEIKTNINVRLDRIISAPYKAVEKIKSRSTIAGKNALVIGNGRMGRLTAEILISETAYVTVTLREYKKGGMRIPSGANTISYGRRYDVLKNARIIISATTSPHFTLHYDEFVAVDATDKIIVDLSVPRDVDPRVGELPGITLLTIDDLGKEDNMIPRDKILLANQIIEKNIQNYYKWREYKESMKWRLYGAREK